MTTRKPLVRWTFAEFRHWIAGSRDKRHTARRPHKHTRRPTLSLARPRLSPA